MHPRRGGTGEGQSQLLAKLGRFHIQVVDYFHVVRNEAHGHQHHLLHARFGQAPQVVQHVRFQPGNLGRTAAALIDQVPVLDRHGLGHPGADLVQLLGVRALASHGQRQAVGGEHDPGGRFFRRPGESGQGFAGP